MTSSRGRISRAAEEVRSESEAYASGAGRPLGSFVVIVGACGAVVAGTGAYLALTGRRIPERLAWPALGLLALASRRLSRQLAKDPVASSLRASFTRVSGSNGEAELAEKVRGHGVRHPVGELAGCPFFLGQRITTAGISGLIVASRITRIVAGLFAGLASAGVSQFAYARLEEG